MDRFYVRRRSACLLDCVSSCNQSVYSLFCCQTLYALLLYVFVPTSFILFPCQKQIWQVTFKTFTIILSFHPQLYAVEHKNKRDQWEYSIGYVMHACDVTLFILLWQFLWNPAKLLYQQDLQFCVSFTVVIFLPCIKSKWSQEIKCLCF